MRLPWQHRLNSYTASSNGHSRGQQTAACYQVSYLTYVASTTNYGSRPTTPNVHGCKQVQPQSNTYPHPPNPLPLLTLRARSLRAIMGVLHRADLVPPPNTLPSNRTACPTSEGPKKAVDARRPLAKEAPRSVDVANFMGASSRVLSRPEERWGWKAQETPLSDTLGAVSADDDAFIMIITEFVLRRRPYRHGRLQ